jgi:ubiquinone/menaquinone biosynthesis C-methylase UbiE
MSESQVQEQIAAATAYEEIFVPALFQQWAPLVVSAARIHPGTRVLDVACGTGVLAEKRRRTWASLDGQSGWISPLVCWR